MKWISEEAKKKLIPDSKIPGFLYIYLSPQKTHSNAHIISTIKYPHNIHMLLIFDIKNPALDSVVGRILKDCVCGFRLVIVNKKSICDG